MPKENPVIAFLNKMADLILLNLLFHCDRYAMEMGMLYRLFSDRLSRILNSLLWRE